MKIVGTIVNRDMSLVGLLLRVKPSTRSGEGSYSINPYKLDEVKTLIRNGKVRDYHIAITGEIVGRDNHKLSDLPMFDNEGNPIDKRIKVRSVIEDEDGELAGANVYFYGLNQDKKLKTEDLVKVCNYAEPLNFSLVCRNNQYFLKGKGGTKKSDIPVVVQGSPLKYKPFNLTEKNRHLVGYKGIENENLIIPDFFKINGENYKVRSIAPAAFYECMGLQSVTLPIGLKTIGYSAFAGCENLKSIEIPNGVELIDKAAFQQCRSLVDIQIPKTVHTLGANVCSDCVNLITASILGPSEVAESSFEGCRNLDKVVLGDNVRAIKEKAFSNSGIRDIVFPTMLVTIGAGAFERCKRLLHIDLPKCISTIEPAAFYYCTGLKEVRFPVLNPNRMFIIQRGTFIGCGFKSITIPEGVIWIGESAFDGSHIESIKLPRSLEGIAEYAFYCCDHLKDIYYAGSEEDWNRINKAELWSVSKEAQENGTVKIHYNSKY